MKSLPPRTSLPRLCRPAGRSAAFTLVELLVVVAIIGLLLGILIPALSGSKREAQRTACASNFHQLHVANINWAQSHNWNFPIGQPLKPSPDDYNGPEWIRDPEDHYFVWKKTEDLRNQTYGRYRKHGALVYNDYLNSGKTLYCPAWKHPYIRYRRTGTGPNSQYGGWYDDIEKEMPDSQVYIQTSYHYNCQFGKPTSIARKDYSDSSVWRPARTSDPSMAALMADAFSDPEKGVDIHHRDGYNVVFIGGNVKYVNDPEFIVRDLKDGNAYNDGLSNYSDYQSKAWRFFEDRLDENEY